MSALLFAMLLQGTDVDAIVSRGLSIDEEGRAKAEAKGKDQKEVLALLLDPKVWAEGVRRIDAKLGLWTGTFEIKVKFGTFALKTPAWGDGVNGKGKIEFDADALAEHHKNAKEHERKKKAAGKNAQVVVPPARMDGIVWHELVHCFASGKLPRWFPEGAGTHVAGDPHFVAYFRHEKQAVKEIDAAIDFKYSYGRGWAFFEWMEAVYGAKVVKKFVGLCVGGKTPAEAAAEATGLDWDKVRKDEKEWSTKWMADYAIK